MEKFKQYRFIADVIPVEGDEYKLNGTIISFNEANARKDIERHLKRISTKISYDIFEEEELG